MVVERAKFVGCCICLYAQFHVWIVPTCINVYVYQENCQNLFIKKDIVRISQRLYVCPPSSFSQPESLTPPAAYFFCGQILGGTPFRYSICSILNHCSQSWLISAIILITARTIHRHELFIDHPQVSLDLLGIYWLVWWPVKIRIWLSKFWKVVKDVQNNSGDTQEMRRGSID